MKTHIITAEDLKAYIAEEHWHTFASSFGRDNKRLQVSIGDLKKRVLHGSEIVYEGYSETEAVERYNSLVGFPENEPKMSN